MLAVMKNALDDYQLYIFAEDRAGRVLFEEVAMWIDCVDRDDLFSFENISETLNIDPGYFRRGLAAWRGGLVGAHARGAAAPHTAPPEESVQAAG